MAKQKIKNYLKKSKSVTAPMNWKSSSSSPKTQLAYVTKPEIDMLVKANIYGSMNGKPNVGPKGIISLDGGGSSKKRKTKKSEGRKTSNAVRTSSYDKGGRNENKDTSRYDNPKNYQTKETKATKKDKQGFAEYVASKDGKSAFERFGGSDVNQSEIDKVRGGIKTVDSRLGTELVGTYPSILAGKTPEEIESEKNKIELEKKEKEKKDNANKTAQELTDWWAKNSKDKKLYENYRERKNILTGKLWGSQEAVTAKLQDKLNKGYYKIVKGPNNEPLIIHASTGTPVNPFTGNIISTQTSGDQGGAYQNEMARITGIDTKHAGVFSKEYQTGNGLSVSEMKPEHALRFLMSKNKGAFEQFFSLNKDKKGFNPFSVSFMGQGMGAILNMITGPEALQVGNNLERAGWGKAVKGEDGKYTIKLTEEGAKGWSDSFNFDTVNIGDKTFSGFTSPEAIAKDQKKGFLSDILGTKKYFDSSGVSTDKPIDLSNLMEQGGYLNQQATSGMSELTDKRLDMAERVGVPKSSSSKQNRTENPVTQQDFRNLTGRYGFTPNTDLRTDNIPGTPSNWVNPKGETSGVNSLTNYPTFTSEGYKIGGYNPSRDYSNQGSGGGGGGQSGNQDQDTDDTTPPPGPLTFDVYGRPVTYDYSGGPEQMYLGGGYKRDGQYIGSPYGYSKGGIANFRPYGY